MHTNLDLILTLTGGLVAALILGYLTKRLGLSPIVGYLLAGVAVGPYTPGFTADRHLAEQLAEVGIILLMFGVGLHFHLKELLAVQRIAVPGAVVQSLVATLLGAVMGWGFGWGWSAGLVYGMAIAVASTVVLIRVLSDNNDLHTPAGHVAVGWLVVEDLFTVVMLVVLPALFGGDAEPDLFTAGVLAPFGGAEACAGGGLALALVLTAVKIALLVALVFLAGGRLLPWILQRVAETRSRELFTLAVLAIALGVAVCSAKLFGVSMALGAFLAGMVVGRSDFSLRAATDALPMRDAFAVLFFVSTGMLFNPRYLVETPWLVGATLGIVMLGKPLAALTIVLLLRYPLRVALAVSVALAQIGEFSFMLASLGRGLGVLPDAAANALVGAAIASISFNPLLYRLVDPIEAWFVRRPRLLRWLGVRSASPGSAATTRDDAGRISRYQAVVVGYGPVGQTLSRLLSDNDIAPIIVEMNLETVRRLREEGQAAIYGDASHRDTLEAAGVDSAAALLLTSSGLRNAAEMIRLARELNPGIRVAVRCTYLREKAGLLQAGADEVFTGEGEVALAMTESFLWRLGATPEQIDRERTRIRTELFGVPTTVNMLTLTDLRPATTSTSPEHPELKPTPSVDGTNTPPTHVAAPAAPTAPGAQVE
ncbi:MAG: cation:proton antiporter [Gemmataceae bacterium]